MVTFLRLSREFYGCPMGYLRDYNGTQFDKPCVYRGLPTDSLWATTLNLSVTPGLPMADAWAPPQLRGFSWATPGLPMGTTHPIVWAHMLWCAKVEAEIGVFDKERTVPPKVGVISSLLPLRGKNSYPNHRAYVLFPSDQLHRIWRLPCVLVRKVREHAMPPYKI